VTPRAADSGASIPLKPEGGTFVVPVLINDKITLDFTLDSGAADVEGTLLLGQSFLSRLQTWSVDNQRHVLIINGTVAKTVPREPPHRASGAGTPPHRASSAAVKPAEAGN
jgi:hypothetical protein